MLLEENTVLSKIEVCDLQAFGTVIALACEVQKQVTWPSKHLVNNAFPQAYDRGILSQFSELNLLSLCLFAVVTRDPGLSIPWHEGRILIHVSGIFMVLAMADAP